jgi:hypothetical protein
VSGTILANFCAIGLASFPHPASGNVVATLDGTAAFTGQATVYYSGCSGAPEDEFTVTYSISGFKD